MFDFHKAYRVMTRQPGREDQLLGIAVGIRPFRAAYPWPFEEHGIGTGFEWIPNSPIWPYRRAFLDVLSERPDRIVAREKFAEFSGNDVTYIFEPVTVGRLAEVKGDIIGYDDVVNEMSTDDDVQEYYVQTWMRPGWTPDGLSAVSDYKEEVQILADFDEAAPVGTVHSRKDGWDWQKQPNKSWIRIRKTHPEEEEPDHPELETPSDVDKRWPDIEPPAGGVWKDEAEGMEHLVRDQRSGQPSTLATYYQEGIPGDDSTIEPTPDYEDRFEEIEEEIRRRSGFMNKRTTPRQGRRPVAVLTMGAPASGKSSAVKNTVAEPLNFVHVDPDAIKTVIPEYREAVHQRAKNAAAIVHRESALLAERLRDDAIDQGKNFVFDGIGRDPVYYGSLIDRLKRKGYEVQLVMTHTDDPETAVARSNLRGEKTGRWVDGNFIRSVLPLVPKSFMELHRKVDAFAVFDTQEFPPKLAWVRRGDQEMVPDPELKDRLSSGEARDTRPRERPESEGDKRAPDVDIEQTIAAFKNAFAYDHSYIEMQPIRFKPGQGIVYPSDDPFTTERKPL